MSGAGFAPLEGIKVLELGHIMAGPVCGRMLADMGADVVKVERVPNGDPSRSFVPPEIDGESAAFMMLNRNKRGIAIDIKRPEGVTLVRRLIRGADVVIENYRTGTLDQLGIGYDSVKSGNPGLVWCEISGFGRTGPYAGIGGFDLIAQGYSGLMSLTGESDGRTPVKCGVPVTDITAGILGAMGVVAAILHRLLTGEGQRVDTSLYEAGITHTYWQSAIALATGESPGPLGSAHPLNAPYQAFETSDGWINLGASTQESWEKVPEIVGQPRLVENELFCDNAARMENLDELVAVLIPLFKQHSTEEWLRRFEAAGVPAGPVASLQEMLNHSQTIEREMVTEVQHSTLGPVKTLGFPVKLGASHAAIERGAPILGEHTLEVLLENGYTKTSVAELQRSSIIICA
ncbi:MAG TPA: CoA transferase [Acidobacteriota bacterium]|jgi:crotonobetainyl-CoA:carnitine CoA-transferase CaiB-like acyl-CoA transferase|nr:CoA transferase [Acidobacteriota bacterium]HJO28912.1 CoA transferase [Acidobacteriota bacterium]|tara:strand:- start:14008 stop:15219 length:1212 start_codon:yes stop_codon:yes gene_type:complete